MSERQCASKHVAFGVTYRCERGPHQTGWHTATVKTGSGRRIIWPGAKRAKPRVPLCAHCAKPVERSHQQIALEVRTLDGHPRMAWHMRCAKEDTALLGYFNLHAINAERLLAIVEKRAADRVLRKSRVKAATKSRLKVVYEGTNP